MYNLSSCYSEMIASLYRDNNTTIWLGAFKIDPILNGLTTAMYTALVTK